MLLYVQKPRGKMLSSVRTIDGMCTMFAEDYTVTVRAGLKGFQRPKD